jgi:hypothetical protein
MNSADGKLPVGLLSLADMINFALKEYMDATILIARIHTATAKAQGSDWIIAGDELAEKKSTFEKVAKVCRELALPRSSSRTTRILNQLNSGSMSAMNLHIETKVLHEAMDDDISHERFFHYDKTKVQFVLSFGTDWSPALISFSSISIDAYSGVDCYALGHNVASVFMMMRVLEKGLKSLASDVGKDFDKQHWHGIIDEIESAIEKLQDTLPRGREKDERLQFLSSAAKEFRYFKDGWRNYVAHGRGEYDEHQALSVVAHVRDFMNHLGTKLHD